MSDKKVIWKFRLVSKYYTASAGTDWLDIYFNA